MIVDNNLLIPWHTFGSSPSTALLQAVAESAHCDADAHIHEYVISLIFTTLNLDPPAQSPGSLDQVPVCVDALLGDRQPFGHFQSTDP